MEKKKEKHLKKSRNGLLGLTESFYDEIKALLLEDDNSEQATGFGYDSMALKCVVELRIADITNSHGGSITLCQIATGIADSPSLDIPYLARIMRSLVCKKILTAHNPSDGGDTLYGLTPASKWLLHDAELGLVQCQCVKEGGFAFKKAHGCEMWDFASKNHEFNKIFNDAMACSAKIVMGVVLEEYKDGFDCLGSLVDVAAPIRKGVSHVGGYMFESIPKADAIFMKWVLHDWSDEHCIKILKNC
ncbi:hypothetical protein ACJW31_12G078900 [Castanea mollissima]